MKKRLKVAILTQPLHDNYGGLLQAYALKETLQDLKYEVVIINRRKWSSKGLRKRISYLRNKLLGRKFISSHYQRTISKETLSFQRKHIPNLTHLIDTDIDMLKLNKIGIDGYVVGSDQCWRPKYSPNIKNYFLDFAKNEKNIKRISYAASFGVSDWEFNEEDTQTCKTLLSQFDAISVREKSGIDLVRNHLGRNDAVHVLDPTLLLSKSHYQQITKQEKYNHSNGNLNVYVLDKSEAKSNLIKKIENSLNLKVFEILPKKRIGFEKVTQKNITDFVFPNPAEWLRGFEDARFVITDSFHGTIFSILYNVPFLTIGNSSRGMARFESVLEMFNLKNRLVYGDLDNLNIMNLINEKINWQQVNEILEKEKKKSIDFLKNNLNYH